MNFRILYTLYFALVFSILFTIGASIFSKDFAEGLKEGYMQGHADLDMQSNFGRWRGYMIPNDIKHSANSTITFNGAAVTESNHSIKAESTPNINAQNTHDVNMESGQSVVKPHVTVSAQRLDVIVHNEFAMPAKFHYYRVVETIFSMLGLVLVIYMLVLLYKLFRRMQKSLQAKEVFSMGVARVIRSLGFVLILFELTFAVFSYMDNHMAQMALSQYGYRIENSIDIDYMTIIFGIALLLVAEFLKIGYKIQEEQSLTV
ncbi:MAG: DUF2975 domain-containing protein [Bacteroidales bacterium]